jgi:hypothetical protein
LQIRCESGDDPGAPTLLQLPLYDQPSQAPVQLDHLGVCGACDPDPRGPHLGFDGFECLRVASRQQLMVWQRLIHTPILADPSAT